MRIFISSDHAGYELKQHLVQYLEENGIEVFDKGPYEFNKDDDYPDWISLTAQEVSRDPEYSRGIVIGLSGQGEAMVANKFRNVRAGVYYGPVSSGSKPDSPGKEPEDDFEIVRLLREHNDANVLSLGAKFLDKKAAERAVDTWIETQFSNDPRHRRRIQKIHVIDANRV